MWSNFYLKSVYVKSYLYFAPFYAYNNHNNQPPNSRMNQIVICLVNLFRAYRTVYDIQYSSVFSHVVVYG